jgi:hypothetical protein
MHLSNTISIDTVVSTQHSPNTSGRNRTATFVSCAIAILALAEGISGFVLSERLEALLMNYPIVLSSRGALAVRVFFPLIIAGLGIGVMTTRLRHVSLLLLFAFSTMLATLHA